MLDVLRQHFRPEFLNRVDEIIVFHPLSREQMRSIIDIQLRGLMKRLEDRKIRVELTDRAKDLLIEEGYDPDLRRAAAQADDPARGAGSARHAGPAGGFRRGRHGPHRRAGRRDRVREGRPPMSAYNHLMAEQPANKPPNRRGDERRGGGQAGAWLDHVVRPRVPAPPRARAGLLLLACSPADGLLQRVQGRSCATARSRRSSSARTGSAGAEAGAGEARSRSFTRRPDRGSEADRGSREARRQVHRRGRRTAGLASCSAGSFRSSSWSRCGASSSAAWAAPKAASCRSRAAAPRSTRTMT